MNAIDALDVVVKATVVLSLIFLGRLALRHLLWLIHGFYFQGFSIVFYPKINGNPIILHILQERFGKIQTCYNNVSHSGAKEDL